MYKDTEIKVRTTEEFKQQLKDYAKRNKMSMSEAIRKLCEEAFKAAEV